LQSKQYRKKRTSKLLETIGKENQRLEDFLGKYMAGKCDFLGKFPTEDGVAQLVMEDGDGPGELVGGDKRLERKRRWPRYCESAPERLNPERDEISSGMGPES
jgi:hypothetical protein